MKLNYICINGNRTVYAKKGVHRPFMWSDWVKDIMLSNFNDDASTRRQ